MSEKSEIGVFEFDMSDKVDRIVESHYEGCERHVGSVFQFRMFFGVFLKPVSLISIVAMVVRTRSTLEVLSSTWLDRLIAWLVQDIVESWFVPRLLWPGTEPYTYVLNWETRLD